MDGVISQTPTFDPKAAETKEKKKEKKKKKRGRTLPLPSNILDYNSDPFR